MLLVDEEKDSNTMSDYSESSSQSTTELETDDDSEESESVEVRISANINEQAVRADLIALAEPFFSEIVTSRRESISVEDVIHSEKKFKLDETVENKKPVSIDDSFNENQKCSICLEIWSNAGEHRLCSLRCGHLFGLKCIEQWFSLAQNAAARKCPECNTRASKKDIRILYAKSYLKCLDTSEIEKLKEKIKEVTAKRDKAEKELQLYKSKEILYEKQLTSLKYKITELEKTVKTIITERNCFSVQTNNVVFKRNKIFDICNSGLCRVMAYNPWHKTLVASSGNTITGILIDIFSATSSYNIHAGQIRDIAFQENHPNFLLSVGFDKKIILTDIRNNLLTHSYQEVSNLWSCCWSNYNHQIFFVGGAKGTISEYDLRFLQSSVSIKENSEDRSPVVALASVPKNSFALQAGGFLACQLNSCYAYAFKEGHYKKNRIHIDGPFTFLRYNEKDNHVLLSCRASAKNQNVRHIVCSIKQFNDQIQFNMVHTFNSGNTQKLLSRPHFMNAKNDTLVVANNENLNNIVAWSILTEKEVYNIPISEPVVDICSFENDSLYQAILTTEKIHLYEINT